MICDQINATVAKRRGKIGQHTMKTQGEVGWRHGQELEDGHSNSNGIRAMMKNTINRQQATDVGEERVYKRGQLRQFVIMVRGQANAAKHRW